MAKQTSYKCAHNEQMNVFIFTPETESFAFKNYKKKYKQNNLKDIFQCFSLQNVTDLIVGTGSELNQLDFLQNWNGVRKMS